DFRDLLGNYLKYAAYILFLVPFVALDSLWLAISAQVVVGIAAAEALGRWVERASGNVGLGRLAMALFLLCPLIQTWTLALYTEYFFTCLAVLFVERMDRDQRATTNVIVLGLITLFARPVGLFVVVPVGMQLLRDRLPARSRPWLMPAAGAALILFALGVPRIEHAQLAPIASGQVIAGIGGLGTQNFHGHTIGAAQGYLVDRVGLWEWGRITLRRTVSLFTLTRPHFSMVHNAVNAVFFVLYPLAIIGLWRSWHQQRVRLVLALIVSITTLVALTHDEWSGRFVVPLLPWLLALALLALGGRSPKAAV
ncbi:MAG: hypothetical protein ACO1NQ_08725, partial [Flavobacteriales bacterium]